MVPSYRLEWLQCGMGYTNNPIRVLIHESNREHCGFIQLYGFRNNPNDWDS